MVVKLYTPHSNQLLIHNSIRNEPYKYYALNIGRQFGKSLLGENQALDWFFNIGNAKIGWVSPVYKQCKKVFKDIDTAFGNNQNVFKDKNKTELVFTGHNGSSINFYSAESYDSAFLSTPKGKNHFHKIHSLDGVNDNYKSFTMTSYDNPIILPSEIDDARLTLPDHVFRSEYLAEFIDGGSGVFKNILINDTPNQTGRYYAGIDLGRADDYTVLTIVNEQGQMIHCERWRHNTWQNIVNELVKKLKAFKCKTYVEVNSIGDAIYEQIKDQYSNIEPFTTTAKSKQDAIETLQVAIQNKEFSCLSIDWLLKEFDIFTYVYNPQTKNVRYSAPNGFHDDGVISSCLAYKALKDLRNSGEIILY